MEKDNKNLNEEIASLKKRIVELEAARVRSNNSDGMLADSQELAENIIDAMRDPLVVMDANLKIVSVNSAFYDTFEVNPKETVNKYIYDLGNRQWDIPKLRELLENILPNNAAFDNYVIEHDFPIIGRRVIVLNARRIPRPPAKPLIMLLVMEDITDMDKVRMTFEKMVEFGIFSKAVQAKEVTVIELREEVNALLVRLGEKLKYTNDKK